MKEGGGKKARGATKERERREKKNGGLNERRERGRGGDGIIIGGERR